MDYGNLIKKETVAKMLNLHPYTVVKMAASGELPATKLKNKWYFDAEMIMEFLEKKMRENVK